MLFPEELFMVNQCTASAQQVLAGQVYQQSTKEVNTAPCLSLLPHPTHSMVNADPVKVKPKFLLKIYQCLTAHKFFQLLKQKQTVITAISTEVGKSSE
ncbi:hypothetical protein EB796_006038 [Bugula neritina]|uniref:Uncharacterized protein n=1 Tax=Bugula neritina TaxID=10212 RepID=A0A7J7KBR3_BUGNE|nr:hypothetical protein EB796_006038 [Bugula neritina]